MNWYLKEIKHIHSARNFPSKTFFKYFWQFVKTGCTDIDTWSVDYCLARKMLSVLKRYRDVCPNSTISAQSSELNKTIEVFEKTTKDEISPISEEFLNTFANFNASKYWW